MCVRRLVYVCPISVNPGGKGRGIIQQSKKSYAPPGLELAGLPDHGLRPWLHFFAATRLGNIQHRRYAAGDHTTSHQRGRSEEHTSELQSQSNLVCRLLLEKKK